MEIETTDENEIPQSLFWRVMFVVNGVVHFVEGLFYHSTVEDALDEYQAIGNTLIRSQGLARKDAVHAAVVERHH